MLIRTAIAIAIIANFIVFLDKRKNNKLILLFSVVLIAVVMAGGVGAPDYRSYERFYETDQYEGIEPLYALISRSAAKTGMSFQWFVAIYMSAGIFIVVKAAEHYSSNYHFAVIIYLLTSIYINTCIMRQFMSYAAYTFAIKELAEGRRYKYCVLILAAAFIHATIIFALPLAFLAGRRNMIRNIFMLMMFLCIITFFNDNKIPGITLLARLIPLSAKLTVYSTYSTNLGFMYCFLFHFTLLFIAKRCFRYIRRNYDDATNNIHLASVVFDSTLYFTVVLPFCMHSYNFIRVVYFNMIPVMFSLSAAMQERRSRKKILMYALLLIVIFEVTSTYGWVRELVLDNNILAEYFTVL